MTNFLTVEANGHTYKVILDHSPEIPTDPVIYAFRDNEDEPLAAIHLNSGNGTHCEQHNHITVGPNKPALKRCGHLVPHADPWECSDYIRTDLPL